MKGAGEALLVLVASGLVGWGLVRLARSRPASSSSSSRSSASSPASPSVAGAGAALLAAARRALERGVQETGKNTGPEVDAYLRAVGIAPPANWCAAAVTAWMKEGFAKLGGSPPIPGGARAKGFAEQLERLGRWTSADKLRASNIAPGNVMVWHRGEPGSWMGHIGVIETVNDDGTVTTIEGNSGPHGDRVARMRRSLKDPKLVGVGSLDPLPIG